MSENILDGPTQQNKLCLAKRIRASTEAKIPAGRYSRPELIRGPFRKKGMEYSFRNSPREEVTVMHLDDFGLTLTKGTFRESFAYANVMAILISRTDHIFKAFLYPGNHRPLVITSYSFAADGRKIDQSKAYSLFIRVLHHHLKDKSQAVFRFGSKSGTMWKRAVAFGLLAFCASLAVSYLGVKFADPYLQSFALAFLVFLLILLFDAGKLPKTYKPTEIPLRFLP